MKARPAPEWLAELQSGFGAVLRTPLDRSTGTLRATPSAYDPDTLRAIVDGPSGRAEEHLAVYNRQYWFRLFGVFQTAFPLTSRLFGHWHFNGHVTRFLLAHPPGHWDLDRAPDGFEVFLAEALGDVEPREVLLDAACLDVTWRALFRAPVTAPFQPRAEDAPRLLDSRLVPSPAVAVLVDRWALLELKASLARSGGESAVPLPAALEQPRSWALVREATGIRHLSLAPREGELLLLLRRHTIGDALAALESACPEQERPALPGQAQRWLARSVERGFWAGLTTEGEAQGMTQV